ncbi:hypothetical protein J6590_001717 [Homalodisca vitripennis]|nr:hypothetical protein J6590_001717 [Homalodisca vitripennis]
MAGVLHVSHLQIIDISTLLSSRAEYGRWHPALVSAANVKMSDISTCKLGRARLECGPLVLSSRAEHGRWHPALVSAANVKMSDISTCKLGRARLECGPLVLSSRAEHGRWHPALVSAANVKCPISRHVSSVGRDKCVVF